MSYRRYTLARSGRREHVNRAAAITMRLLSDVERLMAAGIVNQDDRAREKAEEGTPKVSGRGFARAAVRFSPSLERATLDDGPGLFRMERPFVVVVVFRHHSKHVVHISGSDE